MMANKSKLSHLTKDQKRQRGNVMAWRRNANEDLERSNHYLYLTAIKYIQNPLKMEPLLYWADRATHNMNRLKLINKELKKYEPHN